MPWKHHVTECLAAAPARQDSAQVAHLQVLRKGIALLFDAAELALEICSCSVALSKRALHCSNLFSMMGCSPFQRKIDELCCHAGNAGGIWWQCIKDLHACCVRS